MTMNRLKNTGQAVIIDIGEGKDILYQPTAFGLITLLPTHGPFVVERFRLEVSLNNGDEFPGCLNHIYWLSSY